MPTMSMLSNEMRDCLEACSACTQICLEAAAKCAESGKVAQWRILADCAELCQTAGACLARCSECAASVCACCAAVCERCVQVCRQANDKQLQTAIDACTLCLQHCASLGKAVIHK